MIRLLYRSAFLLALARLACARPSGQARAVERCQRLFEHLERPSGDRP